MECIIPHSAVEANVWTAVRTPSAKTKEKYKNLHYRLAQTESNHFEQNKIMCILPVSLSNCSPKEITGIADAKNMYVVGAKILRKL